MLTPNEILETLGLKGASPTRAVVAFGAMGTDEIQDANIFRQFAGDDAELPSARLLHVVVTYLIHDAAAGKEPDVKECIARAERLARNFRYNFSDAAYAERAAEMAQQRAERQQKLAEMAAERAAAPRETVNPDGTISRRRGRPPAGVRSAFDMAAELYAKATDRSKEAIIAMFQRELGLGFNSAQTYYYKARKEVKVTA